MRIELALTPDPIPSSRGLPEELAGQAGALAEFTGWVRGEEAGRAIAALVYEAYPPMATSQMRRILEDIDKAHPCLWACVTHRVGVVPVGEAAIQVTVAASHRAEAFALLAEFMDRLKQDVPIWKTRALTAAEFKAAPSP